MTEGNALGPIPKRKTVRPVSLALRPAQVDALNYVAAENQYDSLAKAARHVIDAYFAGRLYRGDLPPDVDEKLRDDFHAHDLATTPED